MVLASPLVISGEAKVKVFLILVFITLVAHSFLVVLSEFLASVNICNSLLGFIPAINQVFTEAEYAFLITLPLVITKVPTLVLL